MTTDTSFNPKMKLPNIGFLSLLELTYAPDLNDQFWTQNLSKLPSPAYPTFAFLVILVFVLPKRLGFWGILDLFGGGGPGFLTLESRVL